MTNHISHKKIVILVAPEFDEKFVVYCLCRMREVGLYAKIVSLTSGHLTGLHGLKIFGDTSLSLLMQSRSLFEPQNLIIIPGGYKCIAALLSDPRTHQLMTTTLENDGYVATGHPAQQFLVDMLIPQPKVMSHIISQKEQDIVAFVEELIAQVSS